MVSVVDSDSKNALQRCTRGSLDDKRATKRKSIPQDKTERDLISITLYVLQIRTPNRRISQGDTSVKHVVNADDLATNVKGAWGFIETARAVNAHSPPLGLLPNATKSCLIVGDYSVEHAGRMVEGVRLKLKSDAGLAAVTVSFVFGRWT